MHFPFNLRADTEADYLDSLRVFRVHVLEPPVHKPGGLQLRISLIDYAQQAVLYLRPDSTQATPVAGDILFVSTRLTRPRPLFPGDFDYGAYLRLQHQVGVGYVHPGRWQLVGHAPVHSLRAYAALVQQRLAERYSDAGLSGRALAFMSAITLGERDALDSDLRQSFTAAGAAHVLAVSGLHTGIIYIVLATLLTCFGLRRPLYEQRLRRVLLSLTIILAMWAYAFVTGLSPSVMRAVLMLTIVQVGWMCRRQSLSINTLAAAACICLWIDPLSLFGVSFQLSFAAVVGILLLVPYMNALWRPHSPVLRCLRDLITVSLAATIGTLPVTLYHFGQMSHCFLLTNMLIIPAAYVLVIMGVAVLLLAYTAVGAWLALALKYMCGGVCAYVSWIEHLPHATFRLHATPWMVVCLVVAFAFIYVSMQRKRLAWLVPAVSAVALICVLHVADVRQASQEQALAFRGRTLYYRHGSELEKRALESRYTFFRYSGREYVYAPYVSARRMRALQSYCAQHGIMLVQPDAGL